MNYCGRVKSLKCCILSFRRKPESSIFRQLQIIWTPAFSGVTPFWKAIRVLLAVFLLSAMAAPACAGLENCSMPCCRKADKPVAHPASAVPSKSCCKQTADPADIAGCRFVQHHIALPSGADGGPALTGTTGMAVLEQTILGPDRLSALRRKDSAPPETLLYLRLQTLLI
jgi:hypothetical protein